MVERFRHHVLPVKISPECRNAGLIKYSESHDLFNSTRINFQIINKEIRVLIKFSISTKPLELTVDTGANISLLKPNNLFLNTQVSNRDDITIMGISTSIQMKTIGRVFPEILLNNWIFPHAFHIVEEINVENDGILGSDFLVKYGAVIDYSTNHLQVFLPSTEIQYVRNPINNSVQSNESRESEEIKLESNTNDKIEFVTEDFEFNNNCKVNIGKKTKNQGFYRNLKVQFNKLASKDISHVNLMNEMEINNAIDYLMDEKYDRHVCFTDKLIKKPSKLILRTYDRSKFIFDELNLSHCSADQKYEMMQLCTNYSIAFYVDGDALKHTDIMKHEIELKPGTMPINTRQYRIPESQKEEIQRQLDELESKSIIEKSNSPWNSPLLLVPKKGNQFGERKYRLVIDYRKLNTVTQPVAYPIPLIDEIIDQMQGAQVFTTLDLQGAFHQIPMHSNSKEYTAFSTSWNKYQFNSMPFGLVNSPYTWLRAIHTVLKGIIGFGAYVYMDDIIIYSKTLKEHTKILEKILQKLIHHNLKLNIEKSIFFHDHVTYLGHIISKDGIKVDPKKTECLNNFPRPSTVVELQRFLGMCNYYRRYVYNYAKMAKALYALCKKDIPFIWNPGCEEAFINLKGALTSPPILIFPNFNDTFIVTTDASDFAVGAVISQGNMPHDKPIHYFSKTLSETQTRYSTIEKELLAIVWAIENFRHYLYGRQFLIVTDHKPLTFLLNPKNVNNRLHRGKLILMEYNFEIIHKEGAQNVVADALSRIKNENNSPDMIFKAITKGQKKAQTEDLYYIEENPGFILDKREYDHIFYILESRDCEIFNKLQHKLKTKIRIPTDLKDSDLYEIDKDHTLINCNTSLIATDQNKEIHDSIKNIVKFLH